MLHPTTTLKSLVRLSLLERVSPTLLLTLLRPYRDYLLHRGLALEPERIDYPWLGRLHRILNEPDPQRPHALQQALLDIADIAHDAGHELALHTATEQRIRPLHLNRDLSAEDLAFHLYLEHRELFVATQARLLAQEARRFVDFHPIDARPLLGALHPEKHTYLCEQLRSWFASRNRSDYIDVRIYELPDEISFLVIHGQPPRSLSVITSPSDRHRLRLIPDKQDTILFDKTTGRLSVCAQYAAEHDFYRALIGRTFFGSERHFESQAVIDCGILLDDPSYALSVEGLPLLRTVTLKEIQLEALDAPNDRITWSARDLGGVYFEDIPDLLKRDRFVRRAKLALHMHNAKRPKLVEIAPPNGLSYDRRTDEPVVRGFLFERGFLRHPQLCARPMAAMG